MLDFWFGGKKKEKAFMDSILVPLEVMSKSIEKANCLQLLKMLSELDTFDQKISKLKKELKPPKIKELTSTASEVRTKLIRNLQVLLITKTKLLTELCIKEKWVLAKGYALKLSSDLELIRKDLPSTEECAPLEELSESLFSSIRCLNSRLSKEVQKYSSQPPEDIALSLSFFRDYFSAALSQKQINKNLEEAGITIKDFKQINLRYAEWAEGVLLFLPCRYSIVKNHAPPNYYSDLSEKLRLKIEQFSKLKEICIKYVSYLIRIEQFKEKVFPYLETTYAIHGTNSQSQALGILVKNLSCYGGQGGANFLINAVAATYASTEESGAFIYKTKDLLHEALKYNLTIMFSSEDRRITFSNGQIIEYQEIDFSAGNFAKRKVQLNIISSHIFHRNLKSKFLCVVKDYAAYTKLVRPEFLSLLIDGSRFNLTYEACDWLMDTAEGKRFLKMRFEKLG